MNYLSKSCDIIKKFCNGKLGKLVTVSIPISPAVFQLPPEALAVLGVVGAVHSSISNHIESRNLKKFMEDYCLRNIDDLLDSRDEKLIESAKSGLITALRCKKEEQVANVVAILHGVCKKEITPLDGEDMMNIASELSENEASLLRLIYQVFQRQEQDSLKCSLRDYGENEASLSTISRDKRAFLLSRLNSKGLVNLVSGAIFENDGRTFIPTDVGWKLFRAFTSIQ